MDAGVLSFAACFQNVIHISADVSLFVLMPLYVTIQPNNNFQTYDAGSALIQKEGNMYGALFSIGHNCT